MYTQIFFLEFKCTIQKPVLEDLSSMLKHYDSCFPVFPSKPIYFHMTAMPKVHSVKILTNHIQGLEEGKK